MTDDPRLSDEKTDRALTRLEAQADLWSVEVDLPSMVRNVVSPMRLNRSAPQAVRDNFIARMEQQIDAIVKQAFIEGAYRNHCGTADMTLPCEVRVDAISFAKGTPLGKAIREIARVALGQPATRTESSGG